MHPKHQQDALAGVLGEVGIVQNVIVNERTGHVVDGHLRIALAMRQNQPTVPITYVDLSESEEALILATLDPISALATADADKLRDLLDDVSTGDAALMQMISDMAEREGIVDFGGTDLLTDPDDVPPVPDDPITRPGDLWLLGKHRLLCGDSTNADDVARLMGGERADMVFTDPPYGVDYEGGSGNDKKRLKIAGDVNGIYHEWLSLWRVYATEKTPFYIWFAALHGRQTYDAVDSSGLHVRALLIWNKINPHYGGYMAQYMQKHEPFLYCHIGSPNWYGPTNEVTVWDVVQPSRNELHPTQKPVELAERAIGNSSKPNDLVLDLFGGSGSTLIACEQTNRRCAMMELDPAYCDVIVRRWENATGETATRATEAMAAD